MYYLNTSKDKLNNMLRKIKIVAVFMAFLLTLASCGNGKYRDFNDLILRLADADQTIDHADWLKISDFLDAQKRNFQDFYQDDQLDAEAVKEYIHDFFANRRPPKEIDCSGMEGAIKVNFYLETSGSMMAYDAPQGDGSFKAAIVQMLNNLPGDNANHRIYVVNSEIMPYPQGFSQFLAARNVFDVTRGMGDASYTDFGAIFDQILNKTKDDELSILVTDMIYSTKSMENVNPQKIFAEAQGMTNAVFKSEVKKKAMLVVKMDGSYNGLYYPYNTPNRGMHYIGRRPYYIVIVGTKANIGRLTRDKTYETFAKLPQLRGYKNMYLYGTDEVYHPYYSLLLSGRDLRGRFRPEHGQQTQIHDVESVEADRNSGDVRLALAVDLSKMLIDEDYLTDVDNYEIEADDTWQIKEIRAITKDDRTPDMKEYLGSATHIFVLESKGVTHRQEVEIRLLNKLPAWIAASSTDDDRSVDATHTFGLQYLLQGIYRSYEANSNGKPYYFELELHMDN